MGDFVSNCRISSLFLVCTSPTELQIQSTSSTMTVCLLQLRELGALMPQWTQMPPLTASSLHVSRKLTIQGSATRGFLLSAFYQRIAKGAGGKGPRQKTSKIVKKTSKSFSTLFDNFRAGAKNVKNRQKTSKSFSTLLDNFRAAPFFRPLLQSADSKHLL